MEIKNTLNQKMIITEIKVAGRSIIELIREELRKNKDPRLEANFNIVLIPGESLRIEGVNEIQWLEV